MPNPARPLDPEVTRVGLHPSGQFPESEVAFNSLKKGRIDGAEYLGIPYEQLDYTMPAVRRMLWFLISHYPHQWQHDSEYVAGAYARHGTDESLSMAERELNSLLAPQREDGFTPHIIFASRGRKHDPARTIVYGKDAKTSNYLQPPDLARAIAETYQARLDQQYRDPEAGMKAISFLRPIYPKAKKFYDYLHENRTVGHDKLIYIILTQECGRDSSCEYDDDYKRLLPEYGPNTFWPLRWANALIDYYDELEHDKWLADNDWDTEIARQKFAPKDVMMNCMYAANLYVMSDLALSLGENADAKTFRDRAEEVEDQILTRMYFPKDNNGDGVFWSLDKDNQPIRRLTISSLYPFLLHNLNTVHLQTQDKVIDKHFNPPFPFPTTATTDHTYDPHNHTIDRLSRGPTWIHHNFQLHDYGLAPQIIRLRESGDDPVLTDSLTARAKKVRRASEYAIKKYGAYEHFDPIKFKGQRSRVGKNFAWTWRGMTMTPESVYDPS